MSRNWIDTGAFVVTLGAWIACGVLLVSMWVTELSEGKTIFPLVTVLLTVLLGVVYLFGFHLLPLRIRNGEIVLTPLRHRFLGRKWIRLIEIEEIFIDNVRGWERSWTDDYYWPPFLMVRVRDRSGNKYRNILFPQSLKEFRRALTANGYKGVLKGHGKD